MTEYEEHEVQVSRADVDSVSAKLESLARDLPESERAVLGMVLSRAQAAPDDLDIAAAGRSSAERSNAAFEKPFAGQLARAAGVFEARPDVTVVVGWSYAFLEAEGPTDVVNPSE
ncbi:hypothetical protein ACWIGW_41625 [Nocardia brasiliensis]